MNTLENALYHENLSASDIATINGGSEATYNAGYRIGEAIRIYVTIAGLWSLSNT